MMTVTRSDPDVLAFALRHLAQVGRSMPPAWDGAAVSVPVCGPGGEYVGRVLPGRGLYLAMDLAAAGIRRPIPHVFERSPIQALMDQYAAALRREGVGIVDPAHPPFAVNAISTYDGIIAARGAGRGQDVSLSKASVVAVATTYSSLFRAGGLPVAGTYTNIPGGAAHNKTSVGAWSFGLTNPTSPNRKYLLTLGFTHAATVNMIMLIDLLVAAGNVDANIATTQTINSVALTRYTDGAGVLMTFEITTALGATAANLTVSSYTNQSGASAHTTPAVAMLASGIVQRLTPVALGPFMELASGDYGVRSVESLIMSAAMGSGVFALNLYFPLAFVPGIAANVYVERDSTVQIDGLTELVVGSGQLGCLTALVLANTTTTGIATYFLRTCEG